MTDPTGHSYHLFPGYDPQQPQHQHQQQQRNSLEGFLPHHHHHDSHSLPPPLPHHQHQHHHPELTTLAASTVETEGISIPAANPADFVDAIHHNNDNNHAATLNHHAVAVAPSPVKERASSKKSRNRTWDENYAELVKYKEKFGNCLVPNRWDVDPILGKWVTHLRENKDQRLMTDERKAALNAIGFDWDPYGNRWNENFEKLEAYFKEHGHCRVKATEDAELLRWTRRQRERGCNGTLVDGRKEKLDSIQFQWRLGAPRKSKKRTLVQDGMWQKMYDKLLAFKNETGHCNVPWRHDPDPSLTKWVQKQRINFHQNLMRADRQKLLEKIGFEFDYQEIKKDKHWNNMYNMLKDCQIGDGSFQIPRLGSVPEAAKIARWAQRQRDAYKSHRMEPARYVLLKKINFRFPGQEQVDARMLSGKHRSRSRKSRSSADSDSDMSDDESTGPNDVMGGTGDAMDLENRVGEMMAREIDHDAGKKVAESIDILAKYMNTSPEELAKRLPVPIEDQEKQDCRKCRAAERKKRKRAGAPSKQEEPPLNVLRTLMPRIIQLRDLGTERIVDCGHFLDHVIRQQQKGYREELKVSADSSAYDTLFHLALELNQVISNSKEGREAFKNCMSYIVDMIRSGRKEKYPDQPAESDHGEEEDEDKDDGKDGSDDEGPFEVGADGLLRKRQRSKGDGDEPQQMHAMQMEGQFGYPPMAAGYLGYPPARYPYPPPHYSARPNPFMFNMPVPYGAHPPPHMEDAGIDDPMATDNLPQPNDDGDGNNEFSLQKEDLQKEDKEAPSPKKPAPRASQANDVPRAPTFVCRYDSPHPNLFKTSTGGKLNKDKANEDKNEDGREDADLADATEKDLLDAIEQEVAKAAGDKEPESDDIALV